MIDLSRLRAWLNSTKLQVSSAQDFNRAALYQTIKLLINNLDELQKEISIVNNGSTTTIINTIGLMGPPGIDGYDGTDGIDGNMGPQGIQGIPGSGGGSSADVNRVVATGTTRTIIDKHSSVVVDYFAVEGTGVLAIEGDGALAIL